MTLEAIIAVFPDFRGLAGLRACVDGSGPHMAAQPGGATTPSGRQGAPDPPIIPERAATAAGSGQPARAMMRWQARPVQGRSLRRSPPRSASCSLATPRTTC